MANQVHLLGLLALLLIKSKKKRQPSKPRNLQREYSRLRDLLDDEDQFYEEYRMPIGKFYVLLNILRPHFDGPRSDRSSTTSRELKLAVCLRFFSTGDSFATIARDYNISASNVSKCVMSVCQAIVTRLAPREMPNPTTEMWLNQAALFQSKYRLPHCVSSVGLKHLLVNARTTEPIGVLAVVDANNRFVCVDVGVIGHNHDGGLLPRSDIGRRFGSNKINMPTARTLPGSDIAAPFTLLGGERFSMTNYMLGPYTPAQCSKDPDGSKRLFNSHLSLANRSVDLAFGILTQRWRIFEKPIALEREKAKLVVFATMLLHNFLTPSTFAYDPAKSCSFTDCPMPARISDFSTGKKQATNRENIRLYLQSIP